MAKTRIKSHAFSFSPSKCVGPTRCSVSDFSAPSVQRGKRYRLDGSCVEQEDLDGAHRLRDQRGFHSSFDYDRRYQNLPENVLGKRSTPHFWQIRSSAYPDRLPLFAAAPVAFRFGRKYRINAAGRNLIERHETMLGAGFDGTVGGR